MIELYAHLLPSSGALDQQTDALSRRGRACNTNRFEQPGTRSVSLPSNIVNGKQKAGKQC
jgi:hypothetical protein